MLITVISSVIVLFFFGFNGEAPLDASLTGIELGMRASKSLCAVLMVSGLTYGAERLLGGETQTIQAGENNTDHRFASNGTGPAYVNDHFTSTILGEPATVFWYSTMQTPVSYLNLEGIPLSHTAPDSRKVEAQASHEAHQGMIIFAIMAVLVGGFVHLCCLGLHGISKLLFQGNQSQDQLQKAMDVYFSKVNTVNSVDPVHPVNPAPTDPSIKDKLDAILNDVRTILTRSEVRPGSGDLGNKRYTTDQNANASGSEEVKTTLQNLDSQIQALNRNVDQLRARDQNSRITSMDANIERIIRFIGTRDSNDNIQTLNGRFEALSNHMTEVVEANIDKVSKSVKAIDPTKKIQALGGILEQLRVQTLKALTVDSPHFTALNEQVMGIHKRVLGVPDGFIELKHLTGELNQKVENLDKEMQRASNSYHTLESKIGNLQRDIHISMARRNDVHDATQKIRDELQTIKDMTGEVKKVQKDISKLSSLGGDVRSMTEQLGNIQEDLQTIKPVPGKLQNMDKDIQDIKDELQQKHDSIASKLDTYVRNLGERCTRKDIQDIKDEVQQKHDSIVSKLEANRCICQNTSVVTQEVPNVNNMSGEIQDLRKEIQDFRDEANQKHDSLVSQLEASRCPCQNEPVKTQEESHTVNYNSGKLQELDNKIQEVEAKHHSLLSHLKAYRCTYQDTTDIREEMPHDMGQDIENLQGVQKGHASAVSELKADLRGLKERLTSQETRTDEMKKAHEEKLNRHDESLNRHETSLETHSNSLNGLRIDIEKVKDGDDAETEPEYTKPLGSKRNRLRATKWDKLKAELESNLDDKIKKLDFEIWKQRYGDEVKKLKERVEGSRCKCDAVDLAIKVGKLEEDIKGSRCKCDAVDPAGDAGNLEESVKERMAEDFAEWEKKIEVKLTSLSQDLEFFESARANNGVQLEGVDERVKGLEDQLQKTKDALFEEFRVAKRPNLDEGQQEILDRRLEEIARKFEQGGFAFGMRQLLEVMKRSSRRLGGLENNVQSVLEQLDTFQTQLMSLSQAGSQNTALDQPAIQQTSAVTDQMNVGSQSTTIQPEYLRSVPAQQSTTTTNENVTQQTPAPIQSNAPTVPQSSPIFQLTSRRLSDSDEVPPEMLAILKAPPPGSDSHMYQINQPIPLTQNAPVLQYSPVLQTTTTTGQANVGHQASPPDQPPARDSLVTQPEASSPTASEAQTTEPQDKSANTAGRKIKVPMSRKKSYQKQQQQSQQSPTTDSAFFPQQQQQQQQQEPTEQNEQAQQPLTLEDIIEETLLAGSTTTEPTAQETTAQPPSPPPSPPQMGPEAHAALEAEAAERAQSRMVFDDVFGDYFEEIDQDFEEINNEINKALDEEERIMEERRRGNHPLSLPPLPPTVQSTDVPQNTQGETSQAAAQGSSQKKGESTTQERGTVPEVQSNVAPLAETSKPIETSGEQKKAQEATKPKPASSSSQRPSLSQSRWADDEPTDPAPQDKRSGSVKDSGAQKKADNRDSGQTALRPLRPQAPDFKYPGPKHADKVPQDSTTGIPVKTSEETGNENIDHWTSSVPRPRPLPPNYRPRYLQHVDKVLQESTTGTPVKDSGEQKKAEETVKQVNEPSNVSQSAPKQMDKVPQDSTTGIPVKTSEKKGNENIDHWTSSIPRPRPLPPNYRPRYLQLADKVPQGETTSNPATPSPVRPTRPASSPFLGQSTNRTKFTEKLRAQVKDDGLPEKEAASDLYIQDPADREFRHQAVVKAFDSIKGGGSLYDSRWADPKPEAKEESSKKEKTPESVEKSLATPAKQKPSDDTASPPLRELDERVREEATQEFFKNYKGAPLSESIWAIKDDEKEEPSKKEKLREAVEKKPSGEKSLAAPAKQNDKAPSGHTASTPIKRDDRPTRRRVEDEYKPTPLSASERADEIDEQETAPTPGSPAVQTDSKGKGKEKAVGDEQLGTPDKWNAWASTHGAKSSPADRAGGRSYSKAKGKGNLGGRNPPGTPDKWNSWASTTGGARSSPADATDNGLSKSRWAIKDDEKEGSASTPRSETGRSPFSGPRGNYQVGDVDLKESFYHPEEEHLMKFDRIKGEEEEAAAEGNVTSASAEGLGERNEPISEERHDTVVEDEGDPFAGVEEEVFFLDED